MSLHKNSSKASLFIDYIPAELRENKRWEIIYYVKNPFSKKLVRKAIRVKPMNSITKRRKLGRHLVKNINIELQKGWNPFKTEKNAAAFKVFITEVDQFVKRLRLQLKKGDVRPETLKSYRSYANVIKNYTITYHKENTTIFDVNTNFLIEFLDYIYYDCENSSTTRNNYLSFLKIIFSHFKTKKIIGSNPCDEIKHLPKKQKQKTIIPKGVRQNIVRYLEVENKAYLTLCLACFYCFIRRTELSKIKVKDVILRQGIIQITNTNSKNKKTQSVTIPNNFIMYLADHLKNAVNDDYLFSADNYKPGINQLNPRQISREWNRMKKAIDIPKQYTWYSLKDTGITELLLQGVPTIKVRDQARHHSISQTEVYTPREILKAEAEIKNNNNSF